MEEGRVMFDASAYMLFEASGDSESQYFDGALELESDTAAEDDAQSCSYGSLSDGAGVHEVDAGDDDFCGADFGDFRREDEDDGGGSEEEEDGVVDQCCRRGKAAAVEKPKKSEDCEDSKVKTMNEREGDRLFWEACLAS